MKLIIAAIIAAMLCLTGAKCNTSEGLPIHTKLYWLTVDTTEDIHIGEEPAYGNWIKIGRTFGEQDVWERKY